MSQETRAEGIARRRREREARKAAREAKSQQRQAQREAMGGPMPEAMADPGTDDPLEVCDRDKRPTHAMRNQWAGCAAFLVCGGPSLRQIDLSFLRERGIVSLGINNVAGYAPVRAWCYSDSTHKFHHGIFFDPNIIKFVPKPRLEKNDKSRVRAKLPDGTFRWTGRHVSQCPNVFGFPRETKFFPEQFFSLPYASWGASDKHPEMNYRAKNIFTFFIGFRLLHYLGVRRVYMLGVDFKMDAAQGYAFGQARWPGAVNGNNGKYRIATGMLQELRPHFEKAGFEVYQTNPDSALRVFDYVPLATAIQDCRGAVPPEPWSEDALEGWYEDITPEGQQKPTDAPETAEED